MFKPLVLLLFLLSVLYFPLHMKLLFVYILFCYLLTKFFNGEYISIEVIKISALLTYHELLRKKRLELSACLISDLLETQLQQHLQIPTLDKV